MPTRDRLETLFSARLRLEMSAAKVGVAELSERTGLSTTAIEKLRTGKTAKPRNTTIQKISKALSISEEKFGQSMNGHVFGDFDNELADLERDYGPSVTSALKFGPKQTLWVSYDTCQGADYGAGNVYAEIGDREPKFPKEFLRYRDEIVRINDELIKEPSRGRSFFNGPTFCLSGYHLNHSEDGHERKTLSLEFSRSRYANNVTAKSRNAANLRRKALSQFQPLDQPIEWLSSGVGVAVIVFCSGGSKIVVCRRSDLERFRSREFDISVVEGINPVKDVSDNRPDRVLIHDVVKRAVTAELGFVPDESSVNVIGFGVDLEYYQWNFLCTVESSLDFEQIQLAWQSAEEKFETIELRSISSAPEEAARFAATNPIWSSGLAALYYALLKRSPDQLSIATQFVAAFEKALG